MLSIVLPCYNEEMNIGTTLSTISDYQQIARERIAALETLQVIVVDDGSQDNTAQAAAAVSMAGGTIEVVSHPHNLGYGAALRSGIEKARGEYLLILDGDGQYCIADFDRLWLEMQESGADVVAGCRVQRADCGLRSLNAWLWTTLMKTTLNIPGLDLDCGMKLYRMAALRKVLPLQSTGAFIWAEMTHKLARSGALIRQVPVSHQARAAGEQSGNNINVIARAFKEWLRFLPRRNKS